MPKKHGIDLHFSDANVPPFIAPWKGLLDGVWLDSALTAGDMGVVSVSNLVLKALARTKHHRIRSLYISGHGSPGYQSVGSGRHHDKKGVKSLQLDQVRGPEGFHPLLGTAQGDLQRLRGRFTAHAVVTLGGCNVAAQSNGIDGRELLKTVSWLLGNVAVQGADQYQTPVLPGMEGNVWRARGGSCHIVSSAHTS